MARYASTNRRLDHHLFPKGRSASEPTLIPNVIDSDSGIVQYTSANRITTESTVVDVGTSPNANDGDPLRTAFIKINNFIEAEYRTSELLDQELNRLEFFGPFLGVMNYSDLPLSMISDQNIAVLKTTLRAEGYTSWKSSYPNIISDNIDLAEGDVVLHAGSILQYDKSNNNYKVVYQSKADNIQFDFKTSIAKYKSGTADTDMTAAKQKSLYDNFVQTEAGTNSNLDIKARNVSDAITEAHLRFSQRGFDSGYYG